MIAVITLSSNYYFSANNMSQKTFFKKDFKVQVSKNKDTQFQIPKIEVEEEDENTDHEVYDYFHIETKKIGTSFLFNRSSILSINIVIDVSQGIPIWLKLRSIII
jgi:hypothetical protein